MMNFKVFLVAAVLQSAVGHEINYDNWIPSNNSNCLGSCPPHNEVNFYMPHVDCDKFCQCVWGEPVEMECAPGTHFNPELDVCDWPENIGKTTTEDPEDECDRCIGTCPESHGLPLTCDDYLAHEDCTKYCQCNYGKPIVLECPSPLEFSPKSKVCEWP